MVSQINPPVILAASPDNIAFDKDPGVSYSDELTLVGTATAYSTITVYDGTTALGTTTANSAGVWSYATPSLTDGAHSFTATATVAGVTSVASSAVTQTIAGAISNFSPLTDQWSSPISVGGMPYYAENANINGNAPWAITQLDSHTIRFEVRPNDIWAGNDSHRSEISGGTVYSATSTIDLSYQFTVQPGFNDTSNDLDWQILGQFHADDNDPTYLSIDGGNPPFAFHLTGANGSGEGDYLAVQAFYALPGQKAWTAATLPSDPLNGYLWVSPTPIVRGQAIDVHVEANFQNNASGFLEVWINGQQVVDYHGALGYGGGVYWKEGIYEGWSSNQPITVDYANTSITTKPGAPLILGNVVNGNQVMLNGTAQANSIITIYDGSTKLGTATTSSNGLWFYETNTLAVGGHSLSATATDSAGNVGAASAASATIAAFTGPIVTQVTTSAQTGETVTGSSITFTLKTSSVVSVTGTPTLTLNNGGTAVYSSGSGTNTLKFTYTVGANDSIVKGVAITGANLPNGASITDSSGNAAILTGAAVLFPGVIIDTQPVKTPVFGDPVDNGNGTFTFTGTAGANTTVYFATSYGTALGSAPVDSNGRWTFTTPTLAGNSWTSIQAYNVNSLGDVSAIGSENGIGFGNNSNLPPSPTITGNALVGNVVTLYGSVEAGYSISKVTIFDGTTQIGTASINSNNTWSFSTNTLTNGVHNFSAKVTNAAGTSSGSVSDPITVGTVGSPVNTPPPVDTTVPTVSSLVASGSGITSGNGTLGVGGVVTLTMNLSEAVTVSGGTPTLTLSNGGTATYAGGSGSNALTFSYTVGAGQNTSDLAVTAVNLNAATVKDGAGNTANLAGAVINPSGTLQIDTTVPTVSSLVASGSGITSGNGTLGVGGVVTLTMNLSEAVTVSGGTPTLKLNNGGTATYAGGSGTNALTFSYTVGAGQNTSDLAVTAVNLNSAVAKDSAGNIANLAGAVANPSGTLQINTAATTVSSVAASGTGITSGNGILNAGDVVTLTVNLSSAVTVVGGTPTLALNGGGTATYAGGSGTNALTFSYTVGAGQNTSDLAVTAVNLNSATVKDSAGNTANLAGAVTNPSGTLQIDTTAPTVSSLAASGTGITSGNGILNAGDVVTLTVNLNEAVTVAGGTPTLKLNNGGVAAYTGGSGTKVLTFSYTVGTGQNTSDLAVTAVNLNSATVKDSAGNTANLAGAVTNPSGTLQIDTTTPTVSSVAAAGTGITSGNGILNVGDVVTLTVNLDEAVTVAGGTPTLKLNNGGVAAYTGGSGTKVLTFSYTVGTGQNTSDLAVTAVNLNSATVKDSAGNTANLAGAVTNPSGTLQIDTTTLTIEALGATSLVKAGRNYYMNPVGGGSGPVLKYGDASVVAAQFGVWTPVAAEKTSSGYQIAWQAPGTNQFIIWNTDAKGNYQSNTAELSGNSITLEQAETSFRQDLNGDGTIGVPTTVSTIESSGSTSLVQVGANFYLNPEAGGSGPQLKYAGSAVVAEQFGVWTPVAAEKMSGGYQIAWQAPGTNQFIIWNTDAKGNYQSNTAALSGDSITLEQAETSFRQDLNGDGTIGVPTTVSTIESSGSTSLVQVGANFYLNPVAGGSGPQLKYAGSAVVAEQFGVWTPVAVEKTSSGYQIAWQAPGTNQFIIWNTDSSGNYRNNTGVISGTSASFERAETSFHQDLNGNGVIGVAGAATTAIESLGSTSLAQVGTSFNLTPVDGGSGLELKYYGSPVVAAQFGVWTPIGAEQTPSGYLVAWQAPGTDQFILWTTDSNGNYLSDTGLVLGTSAALQRAENTLHQDLNGDGVIVLSGSGTVIGSNSLIVGSGASVELVGAYSGTIRFAGTTGSLIIDQSTQFGGTISGQLTKGDLIDLRDITAGAGATVTYSGNNSPGNLSVSDGTNTANIALSGNYSLGNFIVSSDGNGGTLLVDPPLSTAQGNEVLTNGSESKSAWLDSIDSKLALWSQHIASAFSSSPFDTSSSGATVNSETGRATPTFQLATSVISQQQYPS
ncbi:heparin lyase I family protein [Bradyrhizobium sp. A5]|uniref:heparin lyase I family protein n=1 Tax=Bradyrhizobium sp. A5 TaxID=3133696 RepID=UPI0032432130